MATKGTLGMLVAALMVSVCLGSLGCKDEPSSVDKAAATPPKPPAEKSNVTVMKTPVPYGMKVPCAKLFPDAAAVSTALGKQVTIEDKSGSDSEAASVCRFKLAGTPPSEKEQARMIEKNNHVLGVLPGDELCQVTAYCAFMFDAAEMKKKCEADGKTVSQGELGEVACVKTLEAGSEYRHVYEVLDADTRCKYLINPGPSVTQEEIVKSCAKAAVDLIGPASIQVQ